MPPLCPPRACSRATSLGGIHNSQHGQQAGLWESGGKPPHSKTTERRYRQESMVTFTRASYWLAKLSRLRVDRARGVPAPHKPLLLLALCDSVESASLSRDVLPLSPEPVFRLYTCWGIVAARRHQRPDIRLPFHRACRAERRSALGRPRRSITPHLLTADCLLRLAKPMSRSRHG